MSDVEKYGLISLVLIGTVLLVIVVKDQMAQADEQDPFADAVAAHVQEPPAGSIVSQRPVVLSTDLPPARTRSSKGSGKGGGKASSRLMQPVAGKAGPVVHRVRPLDGLEKQFRPDEAPILYPGDRSAAPVKSRSQESGRLRRILHEIESGDTLTAISKKHLGTTRRWQEILALNPGLDASNLTVGETIVIQAGGKATQTAASGGSTWKGRTYEVQPGDTLSGIAEAQLGSIGRTDDLYRANRDVLRTKHDLRVGQILKLP